jgi:dipeptidyl aminopeptidase/acylaminoacyl peptidase
VRAAEIHSAGTFETVFFPALDGTRLEGWLFRPTGAKRVPLVLMAPGLTGTKEGFYEPYAWRFVEAGLAVLLFDYRCFGGSEGEPRHWVDPLRHREDYEAALAFARGELDGADKVDPARIALWGSSFSGGTALVLAAQRPEIRAVVAQCPYLEASAAQTPRGLELARYVAWTAIDSLRARLGLRALYVPAFGRPGEIAFAKSAENPSVRDPSHSGRHQFWKRLPDPHRGGWENKLAARVFATLDESVPMDSVARVRCPVLLVAATEDDMVPAAQVREAFTRLANPASRLHEHRGLHFDVYLDGVAERLAAVEAEFLARALS